MRELHYAEVHVQHSTIEQPMSALPAEPEVSQKQGSHCADLQYSTNPPLHVESVQCAIVMEETNTNMVGLLMNLILL